MRKIKDCYEVAKRDEWFWDDNCLFQNNLWVVIPLKKGEIRIHKKNNKIDVYTKKNNFNYKRIKP